VRIEIKLNPLAGKYVDINTPLLQNHVLILNRHINTIHPILRKLSYILTNLRASNLCFNWCGNSSNTSPLFSKSYCL